MDRKSTNPFLLTVLTVAATAMLLAVVDWFQSQAELANLRIRVEQQVARVRADIETTLNLRTQFALGLRTYVACNPDLESGDFANYARQVLKDAPGIRSLTLIPNNVIRDVFPREGNEKAIGLDVVADPIQGRAAQRAINLRSPVMTGPIALAQGGRSVCGASPGLSWGSSGRRILGTGLSSGGS